MQDSLELILNDIYTLDPTLKEQAGEVRVIVAALMAAKPAITPDELFKRNLRRALLVTRLPEPKVNYQVIPWWMMYLAPVGVAAILIFMMVPRPLSHLPAPTPQEEFGPSDMSPQSLDESASKMSNPVSPAADTSLMQMTGDLPVGDSFGLSTQVPGDTVVVDFASLIAPGFLVIQTNVAGEPGEIIGISPLLRDGNTEQIEISLTVTTQAGETFYATLYRDDDSDGVFKPEVDMPAYDSSGTVPLYQLFSTAP